MTTFSNLKTYLPSALKHVFGCHFKYLWKKRNIIVTFQSGQLTEQPKTLDDIGRSDLKMFRNCPLRIEIITGSHIFILFLPRVGTLCRIFYHEHKYMANGNYFDSNRTITEHFQIETA